jgi:hypothetical protein
MTVIQNAVTTNESILLSLVADIQIGIELYTTIKELTLHNLVWVLFKSVQYEIDFSNNDAADWAV